MHSRPWTALSRVAYTVALATAALTLASPARVKAEGGGVGAAWHTGGSVSSFAARTPQLDLDAAMSRVFVPDGGGARLRGGVFAYTLRAPRQHGGRGVWFVRLLQDHGPEARFGIVRDVVDARAGWLRSRLGGQLLTTLALRANVFAPEQFDQLPTSFRLGRMSALMVEAVVTLDLRDRPRDPRRGLYARVALHQAGTGRASSWDYFRFAAEVRGYLPLTRGVVLATRFALGGLFVLASHGLGAQSVHSLDALGPLSEQLQGGGIGSHRGFRRGGLGGVRRAVTGVGPDGRVVHFRPVVVGGGNFRWEGSIELRVPMRRLFDAVLFADVGDVVRSSDPGPGALNLAGGFGIRRRTKVGVLRLEWAFRPASLQYLGRGSLKAECADADDVDCRPAPKVAGVPGALHLSVAEPF